MTTVELSPEADESGGAYRESITGAFLDSDPGMRETAGFVLSGG